MVQAPAPSRPITGSMAGGSLLAYVLVSKFDDHLPLCRQNEILARMGAEIPRSTVRPFDAGPAAGDRRDRGGGPGPRHSARRRHSDPLAGAGTTRRASARA